MGPNRSAIVYSRLGLVEVPLSHSGRRLVDAADVMNELHAGLYIGTASRTIACFSSFGATRNAITFAVLP